VYPMLQPKRKRTRKTQVMHCNTTCSINVSEEKYTQLTLPFLVNNYFLVNNNFLHFVQFS
jgi:hypothetical protein